MLYHAVNSIGYMRTHIPALVGLPPTCRTSLRMVALCQRERGRLPLGGHPRAKRTVQAEAVGGRTKVRAAAQDTRPGILRPPRNPWKCGGNPEAAYLFLFLSPDLFLSSPFPVISLSQIM